MLSAHKLSLVILYRLINSLLLAKYIGYMIKNICENVCSRSVVTIFVSIMQVMFVTLVSTA